MGDLRHDLRMYFDALASQVEEGASVGQEPGRVASSPRAGWRVAVVAAVMTVIIGAGVALIANRGGDGGTTIGSTRSKSSDSSFEGSTFGGVRVSVSLPSPIGDGLTLEREAAALFVDGHSWRVAISRIRLEEVMPTASPETRLPFTEVRIDLGANQVGGQLAEWSLVASGDGMTSQSADLLLTELAKVTISDRGVVYAGDAQVGPIDSPDVAARNREVAVSVFSRPCSIEATQATATGLAYAGIDDPQRGIPLHVFCASEDGIELWLETGVSLTIRQIDEVSVTAEP